ncbi:MAG: hypothetical protein AB1478_11260, partial [Nitrospirota bacterium]
MKRMEAGMMMKFEFEKYSGKEISDNDYNSIQIVYNYHPSIADVGGKNQLAQLYCIGGMRIIDDMLPTALFCQKLDEELEKLNSRIDSL